MVELLNSWLRSQGISSGSSDFISWGITAVVVILLAVLANALVKNILLRALYFIVRKSKTKWDDALLNRKVFHRLANLAPILVVYFAAPIFPGFQTAIQHIVLSAAAMVIIFTLNALLNAFGDVYRTFEVSKEIPITGYIQVVKIIIFIIGGIYIIATLMNRSPWVLLSGIGAMTAILLLIFRDSILGLVAGIQLSANDMVKPGDWISMPRYGADGDVIDVSLNTVKVRNWDKTITTIPTYALISESFQNWRGMQESGGRRIKRSVNIDINTIKFCNAEMIERFKRIKYITEYVNKKIEELDKHNKDIEADTSTLVNGRHMTNVGTFRAYVGAYLKNHPMVHQDMTFLVRQLAPNENGLPIEIYVFSKDIRWAYYEAIQADIFDHILAVVPEFELRVFQNPSGNDIQKLAGTITK
ncbi:MAG: mechanosensitive ion channel [candidate division Zixibacteria bacterium]|nr:mechanosensitive ion channel [candidate division Zixibacteria bacterium]